MHGRLLDVNNVCRGKGAGMFNHFLVEARLNVVGGWRNARRMEWKNGVEGE